MPHEIDAADCIIAGPARLVIYQGIHKQQEDNHLFRRTIIKQYMHYINKNIYQQFSCNLKKISYSL